MLQIEKLFFNACIKKYSKKFISQEEFAKGITDKYMISRLCHGYTTNSKIYHQLIEKLGFYYDDNPDFISCGVLFTTLLQQCEIHQKEQIIETLQQIEVYIEKHKGHLYFEELNYYINLLKKHYLKKEHIHIDKENLSTFFYFADSFKTVFIHAICENLLFHGDFNTLEKFYTTIDKPQKDHFLLQYFEMVILQAHKKSIETYKIYRNYYYSFLENKDYHNAIRFYLIYIQGDIRKHAQDILSKLDKTQTLIQKMETESDYHSFIPYIYAIIHIRNNKHEQAYKNICDGVANHPNLNSIYYPYYVLLSILLSKKIDSAIKYEENDFNTHCMYLYQLYENNQKKEMLKYIVKTFPKICCENPCFETLIHVLQNMIFDFSKEAHSYKIGIQFFDEYRKYNKNYYL